MQHLKDNPDKIANVKAVVKCSVVPKFDAQQYFHPSIEGKTLKRIPFKFLVDEFLPNVVKNSPFTKSILTAMISKDKNAPHNILYRISLTLPDSNIGPMKKSRWIECYTFRIVDVNVWRLIVWDDRFVIDWKMSCHFKLEPEYDGQVDRSAHNYTHIVFVLNVPWRVPLLDDVKITAAWQIEDGQFYNRAKLLDPLKPYLSVPVWSIFGQELMDDRIPALEFQDVPSQLALMPAVETTPTLLQLGDTTPRSLESSLGSVMGDDDATEPDAGGDSTVGATSVEADTETTAASPISLTHASVTLATPPLPSPPSGSLAEGPSTTSSSSSTQLVSIPGVRRRGPQTASAKKQEAVAAAQQQIDNK